MPAASDPLATLNTRLHELPSAEVREPSLPMAVFNQQGHDVVTFLEKNPEVKERLLKVGLAREVLELLPVAIGASQAAESAWQAVFSRRRPEDFLTLEKECAELRSDVIAALRWNLRDDRIAQGTLDAIQEGEGVADLAQDLDALAVLIEQHEGAFDADQTFDPDEKGHACRVKAKELRDATSGANAELTRHEAKDLRDRAFTLADELLDEVRASARYAFRAEPELLSKFQDRYSARLNRRSRRRAKKSAAPTAPAPAPADA